MEISRRVKNLKNSENSKNIWIDGLKFWESSFNWKVILKGINVLLMGVFDQQGYIHENNYDEDNGSMSMNSKPKGISSEVVQSWIRWR